MPSNNFYFTRAAKRAYLHSALHTLLLAIALVGFAPGGCLAVPLTPHGIVNPPSPPTSPPPAPNVRVLAGGGPSVDVDVNPTGSSSFSAVVDNAPVTDDEVNVDGPHWTWGGGGSFLDDGFPASDPDHDPAASGSVTVTTQPHGPDTDNNCDYTATFDNPGDYILTLTATATYYETILQGPNKGQVNTVSFSGSDNPGSPDPDASTPADAPAVDRSNTVSADVPHSLTPNDVPSSSKPAPYIVSASGSGKNVYITSSLDPTYHKGAPVASGDPSRVPDPIGAVNTVNHVLGTTINYSAHLKGNWANGSHYLWHDNWGDPDDGKTSQDDFSGTSIPSFGVTYGSLATLAHVYLHLTPHTPAITANLNVTLHDTVENYQPQDKLDQDHPLPTQPTNLNYGAEWHKLGPTQDKSIEFESQISGSFTTSITTDTTVGVDGESAGITVKLEQQLSVENEKEYGVDNSTKQVLDFKDGYLYYVFWGLGWTRHFGTYDIYDDHGYKGRDHWHADIPQLTPGGGVFVVYRPFLYKAVPSE